MTPLQGKDPFYAKVLDEHRELRGRLAALEDKLAEVLAPAPGRAPDYEELRKLLASLLVHVEQHFAEEEEGGILDEAMCRLPRLCPQAAALERQHKPLLQQLARIVERAGDCGSSENRWRSLAAEFNRFTYAIRAHEAAENRIAEEAFNEEAINGDLRL
jgi:hypothetical protein